MLTDIVELQTEFQPPFGPAWPVGTEVEIAQKTRHGWQVEYKTLDNRAGSQAIPRSGLPPELSALVENS